MAGNKEKRRDYWLKSKYNITSKDYDKMLKAQNNGCWICGRKPKTQRLHIDHSHSTGKVRGLLCMFCNYGLGRRGFQDSVENLRCAALYLEKEIPNKLKIKEIK